MLRLKILASAVPLLVAATFARGAAALIVGARGAPRRMAAASL